MKKITLKKKNIYGIDTLYPACETSEMFAALAGQKTITERALKIITGNGYIVEIIS